MGVELLIQALATWRISYTIMNERGPYDILTRFRKAFGVKHTEDGEPVGYPDNSIFMCIYCLSIWIGLAVWLLPLVVSIPFALSALAVGYNAIIDRLGKED